MENVFLARPNKIYQKSFEGYVLAYKEADDIFYFDKYKKALDDFQGYIRNLENHSKGIDVPYGEVAVSTYWLIDNDDVVGVVRIRHQDVECDGHIGYDISPFHRNRGYGSHILRLAIEKAREIGIGEVFVTCNVDNIASKKIIEKNNGKFLGTVYDEEEDEKLYRYSIYIVL